MTNLLYQRNLEVLYFVYGLAFFSMGMAIGANNRRYSAFNLAKNLWAMAAFGIIYGLAEWFDVGISTHRFEFLANIAMPLEIIITGLSFTFLFYFGVSLICDHKPVKKSFILAPWAVYGLWLSTFFATYYVFGVVSLNNWYNMALIWARYILVFPGSLFTAYGLFLEARALKSLGVKTLEWDIKAAGVVFIGFGIFAGVIVNGANFFPASVMNKQVFASAIGVPVEILRTICAVAIALFSIRILRVFAIEQTELAREIAQTRASFAEREKIRQELHDGIIQSIYAVGLRLACASRLLEQESPANQHIETSISNLNQVIEELRAYLSTLKPEVFTWSDLRRCLASITSEMAETQGIQVQVTCAEGGDFLSNYQIEPVFRICKEALHNISKHAQATSATVALYFKQEGFFLEIGDNGTGFAVREMDLRGGDKGSGLGYMQERAKCLGGHLTLKSVPSEGTTIQVYVPRTGKGVREFA